MNEYAINVLRKNMIVGQTIIMNYDEIMMKIMMSYGENLMKIMIKFVDDLVTTGMSTALKTVITQ